MSFRRKSWKQPGVIALILMTAAWVSIRGGELAAPQRVKIGLAKSLFKDVPDSVLTLMSEPFNKLMYSQTGMSGDLVKADDAEDLALKLTSDQVQLGIFIGIEFAWVRTKYPNLKPLMLAVSEQQRLHAYLLVRGDSAFSSIADLKGKVLSVPKNNKLHCTLFMERGFREQCSCRPEEWLAKLAVAPTCEDAMDDVIDKVAEACVMDGAALNAFKRRKPGRFAALKIAAESEVFPAAVVAYCPGVLDASALSRFHDGMKLANQTVLGKQLLTLWRISGFEAVPDDYEKTCTDIVKSYPPPLGK